MTTDYDVWSRSVKMFVYNPATTLLYCITVGTLRLVINA